jgi:starch synthase
MPDETGVLVPFDAESETSPEPRDPKGFSLSLASAVNTLMANPDRRAAMGKAARRRVVEHFSWRHIAEETLAFYRELLKTRV